MRPNIEEVLRYLGAGEDAPADLRQSVEEVGRELDLQPRWTWQVVSLDEACPIPLEGKLARTMLAQCDRAVVFCCTLGMEFDTMLRAWQARDMARAVILDAWGSAWVESGCDEAEKEIAERFPGLFLTDRFSPGYGDLPLALQEDICRLLDLQRRLGIYMAENYFLTPQKTVTAISGLAESPQMARIRGCDCCAMRENCLLRKGGKRCAL